MMMALSHPAGYVLLLSPPVPQGPWAIVLPDTHSPWVNNEKLKSKSVILRNILIITGADRLGSPPQL